MKYVILLYADETHFPTLAEEERHAVIRAHVAFDEVMERRGAIVAGQALADTDVATTLRHDGDDRPVLTDGPFAETVEQLGGFYVVEASDLDVVTAACQVLPHHYTVEIRPVVDMAPRFAEVEGQPVVEGADVG